MHCRHVFTMANGELFRTCNALLDVSNVSSIAAHGTEFNGSNPISRRVVEI